MRKTLLALSVLAGLAGGTAAPADAAPLAHGLLPSADALLPVANTATDAVVSEGASVQTVQYYRRYRRYGHGSYYGRRYGHRSYYGRRYGHRSYYDRRYYSRY